MVVVCGRILGAIVVLALGMVLATGVAGGVAGDAASWWQWGVGALVAAGAAAVVAVLAFAGIGHAASTGAAAWLALLAGAQARHRRADGVGALLAGVLAVAGGLWLRGRGVAAGEARWATMGVLAIAAGAGLGLVPAVAMLWTTRRAPAALAGSRDQEPSAKGGIQLVIAAATIGLTLAMAAVEIVAVARLRDGRATLAPGDWADGCVVASGQTCPRDARLAFVTPRSGQVRVEAIANCDVTLHDAFDAPLSVLTDAAVRALGLTPGDGTERRRQLLAEVAPGAPVAVVVRPRGEQACAYSVRYLPAVRP